MFKLEKYNTVLAITDKLFTTYPMEDQRVASNNLSKEIIDFKVKVLFVGGFNAGKSTLINSLLERDLLKEEQVAETAIATELVFDQEESATLHRRDGALINCPIENASEYAAKDFTKFVFKVNNNTLKHFNDYLIVDMPGFDSGIEDHNIALMQYIEQCVVYIFLVDCEKGAISDSALNFLSEIRNYSNNIGFILNKSDKQLPANLQNIKAHIEASICGATGVNPVFIVTSKYDADVATKIYDLIKSFKPQRILEEKFDPQFRGLIENICQSLSTIRSSMDFNPYEINQQISAREKSKQTLLLSLNNEKKNLHNKLQNTVKPNILADIQTALSSGIDTLALSLQAGGPAFSQSVNSIIRPVLVSSIEKNISLTFTEFVDNLIIDQNREIDASEVASNVSTIFNKLRDVSSKAESYSGLYKTVMTALSVTTTVVAPWLELILIFLPEILSLFSGAVQSKQLNTLKNRINDEIIPNIRAKLEPEITQSLQEVEDKMLAEIEEYFNQLIDVEIHALENLKNLKADKLTALQNSRSMIDSSISELQQLAITLAN